MNGLSTQSPPAVPPIELDELVKLRRKAASRLSAGARLGSIAGAADALSVLHALASSPATAADALALLHELQVYQVEVDLQALQLRESHAELEASLGRQSELYDFQPAGSLTIDAALRMHELNRTGADMLGVVREDAIGLAFDAFLDAGSARRFKLALASLQEHKTRVTCHLLLRSGAGRPRSLIAGIGNDPASSRFLVSLLELEDEAAAGRPGDGWHR